MKRIDSFGSAPYPALPGKKTSFAGATLFQPANVGKRTVPRYGRRFSGGKRREG